MPAIGNVKSEQSVNTGNSKKIKLYETDFTFNSLPLNSVYDKTMTVEKYFQTYKIMSIPQSMISERDIVLEMIDSQGNVLTLDKVLSAGVYTLKLSVTDSDFQTAVIENGVEKLESITKEIHINKCEVGEITILNGDREIFKNGNVYEVYEGSSIALFAKANEGFNIVITITNEDGEIVNEPEDVGEYKVLLQSADENYSLLTSEYTLIIKARTLE